MMKIAVITGASSGLGKEFVKRVDKYRNIDEIWLIARREDRLHELAETLVHNVKILPLDLTVPSSIEVIKSELAAVQDMEVSLLINCAGFAKTGDYSSISLRDTDNMIELNCRAAVDLTVTVLPYMKRGGRIMEICSTAAFQPFTQLAVYAASKAFLYRYTRALRWELMPRGIRVTAVCPYWIKNTEFISTAKNNEGKHSDAIRNFAFSGNSGSVAAISLWAGRMGFPVVTPGFICTLHRIICKLLPHEILLPFWDLWRRL